MDSTAVLNPQGPLLEVESHRMERAVDFGTVTKDGIQIFWQIVGVDVLRCGQNLKAPVLFVRVAQRKLDADVVGWRADAGKEAGATVAMPPLVATA